MNEGSQDEVDYMSLMREAKATMKEEVEKPQTLYKVVLTDRTGTRREYKIHDWSLISAIRNAVAIMSAEDHQLIKKSEDMQPVQEEKLENGVDQLGELPKLEEANSFFVSGTLELKDYPGTKVTEATHYPDQVIAHERPVEVVMPVKK